MIFFFSLIYYILFICSQLPGQFFVFGPVTYLVFICMYIWIFPTIVLFYVLRGIFRTLDFTHLEHVRLYNYYECL